MTDLFTFEVTVKPEWIDHNNHLNVAYFVLAFDYATDAFYETCLIGNEYPTISGCSVFTLGMDVDYFAELFSEDSVTIQTQLLDWDHKRIHYYHTMIENRSGKRAATNECLAMNVNLEKRKSAPFPAEVQERLRAVHQQHKGAELPERMGRRLAIAKR